MRKGFEHIKGGWLQMFAEDPNPAAGGNQPSGGDPNQPVPKAYTEEEVKQLQNAAAAKARKAAEAEFKPKLEAAEKAVEAAKPFLENPAGYMTQYLAQNPAVLTAVADGLERMQRGQAPTAAQTAAVARAADDADNPKVAKQLEELQKQMEAMKTEREEVAALEADLKTFAKEWTKEFGESAKFDRDDFLAFVDKYAEENEIGDDDPVDTKLLFRLYKAENRGNSRRPPKLPGGASPPSQAKHDPTKRSWDELAGDVEGALRAASQ